MRKVDSLLFGTAGIPVGVTGNTIDGIKGIKKLGLGAMELEFVQSVNISEKTAPDVKKAAEQEDVVLTCHAQYFINLNAQEKAKLEASKQRLLNAARRLHQCGGWSVAFHPAYYMKQDPTKVYEIVKKNLKEVVKTLQNENVEIWVRPELTGRPTAFGDLKEICKLSQDIEMVLPCIDVAHLHARTGGKENTTAEFRKQLELVEKHCGKEALKNMHFHIAGIAYSEKGEKNHLELEESDFNFKDIIKVWKEFKLQGVVVSESPNLEKDALLLQRLYRK
jgi:deoxyribonuclease-4